MGGKTKTKTTQKTDATLDPFSRRLIMDGRRNVRALQDANPFQSYEADRVAGLSELEQGAQTQFMEGQGIGQGLMGVAAQNAMEAGGYQPERVVARDFRDLGSDGLEAYANPFTDAVIDANARRIRTQRDGAMADGRDAALASGAWGGSRSGIQQAETARNFDQMEADMAARLQADAFNSAANLFTADANRSLQADTTNANMGLAGAQLGLQSAGLLGQIGTDFDASNRANSGMLAAFGANERGLEQARLDAAYQDFLRQDQDVQRRIATELSMMGMTPIVTDSNSTGTSVQRSSPGLMGIAGMGLQAAGLFSDARLKRDVSFMERIDGLNLYEYRYLWDADDAPLRTGVMAQEVAQTHPHAVETDPASGFLKVRYDALLETL